MPHDCQVSRQCETSAELTYIVRGNNGGLQFSWRDERRESEAHLVGPAQLLTQGPWGKSTNTTEWLNTYVCTVCACLLKRCTERHPPHPPCCFPVCMLMSCCSVVCSPDVPFLWMQHLIITSRIFLQVWHQRLLGLKDELMRMSTSKSKVKVRLTS